MPELQNSEQGLCEDEYEMHKRLNNKRAILDPYSVTYQSNNDIQCGVTRPRRVSDITEDEFNGSQTMPDFSA